MMTEREPLHTETRRTNMDFVEQTVIDNSGKGITDMS